MSDVLTGDAEYGDSENTLLLKLATAAQGLSGGGGGGGGAPTGAAGGDLSGSYPNPAVTKLAGVTPTAAFLTLVDDADIGAIRTTLGLGTLATQSGTFSGTSSGTNTGDQDLSGLVPTTRTVNGQALSGNITVTAAAGTLTDTTLAANVVTSSLTSVGTLTAGATGAGFTIALATSTLTGTVPLANLPVTALGSGSATAVNLGNSATNGIWFGSNTLNFSTNGVTKFAISSAGTITIGAGSGSITNGGTFSGASGSAGTPTYGWVTEGGAGDYRAGAADLRKAVSSADVQQWKAGHTLTLDTAGTMSKMAPRAANTADSAAISNTTTPTAFSVTKNVVTPAFIVGKPIHFRAWLKYSTAAVPGTLTLKAKLGSVEMSTSGALVVTGSQTNQGIMVEGEFIPRTLGASGTLASHVSFNVSSDSLLIGQSINRIVPSNGTKTVDTAATQVVSIEATWATADASNTILLESLTVQ